MAKNQIATGHVKPFTPAADVASGELVLVGSILLLSLAAYAAADTKAQGHVAGVWQVPKLETDNVADGAVLYFDAANKRVTLDDNGGANVYAGKAWAAADDSADSDTVYLWLNAPR